MGLGIRRFAHSLELRRAKLGDRVLIGEGTTRRSRGVWIKAQLFNLLIQPVLFVAGALIALLLALVALLFLFGLLSDLVILLLVVVVKLTLIALNGIILLLQTHERIVPL
jgi:hypothetical protein